MSGRIGVKVQEDDTRAGAMKDQVLAVMGCIYGGFFTEDAMVAFRRLSNVTKSPRTPEVIHGYDGAMRGASRPTPTGSPAAGVFLAPSRAETKPPPFPRGR